MVGGVNELSTLLAVPPVASARGEIGIPREPISHTRNTRFRHSICGESRPGRTLPPRVARTDRTDQHYPRFALLATLFHQSRRAGPAPPAATLPAAGSTSFGRRLR